MNGKHLACLSPLFVVVVALFCGCLTQESQKEATIKNIIRGGQSVREEVLSASGGLMSDYDVYRDGNNDGVVYEYVYAEDTILDKSEQAQQTMRQGLVQMLADAESQRMLKMGIYFRFIYLTSDGDIAFQHTITSADY